MRLCRGPSASTEPVPWTGGGTGGLAAIGILNYDGNGNGGVLQSVSRNGDYSYNAPGNFTHHLASDCTDTGHVNGDEFVRFVVVDGGRTIYMFSESDGNASTESGPG